MVERAAHHRCASHQCLPKEQQHALLAHGSFLKAVGGGQSELEAQRRPHNKARPPVLELALRQPSWMSPKIRAPAPASDVHGREYRARPSGHERDAERTERACADCAAAGGRRTGDRKGGCQRTEAVERTPTAAQPPRQSVVSAATTQKRFLLDFVPKGQRHRPPRAASLSVLCCSKSVTFMENGPEGGMRAAGSALCACLAN